jgi:phosphotriesterase-related protein
MMTNRREFLARTAAAGIAAAISIPITRASKAAAPTRLTSKLHRPGVVQTVLGPLEASKLGFTLTHEHIDGWTPEFQKIWPKSFGGRAGFVAQAVDKLKAVRAEGVSTIVDLSPYDVGRDVRLFEEISRKSGMHIVACTGKRPSPPNSTDARTTEELAELFIREIDQGIDGTDIKAGVIKVATLGNGVTAFKERALRAAARAAKATGVPIETHTRADLRGGEKQAEIFEAERVDPIRVSLGHSDDSGDMDYLRGLTKRGYTLGMDHVNRGLSPVSPLTRRVYQTTHRRRLRRQDILPT